MAPLRVVISVRGRRRIEPLRLEQPERAEVSLRAQLGLLPRDSDAYFALGVALRAQQTAVGARNQRSYALEAEQEAKKQAKAKKESRLDVPSTSAESGATAAAAPTASICSLAVATGGSAAALA